jgi:recombination protein U
MATNRGKYFEEWLEITNATYNMKGLAVINKIATPWKVLRKYNPYTTQYEIASAYPESKSTVDFGGTACTYSIWFDAKVTKIKTSFPLSNIHKHQINYLHDVHRQGGKAFLLIHSEHLKKTWLLWIDQLLGFMKSEKRKSLPFQWLDENCSIVTQRNGIILDYLPHVLEQRERK